MAELEPKIITIKGVLVPDQWSKKGVISGFALCTNDEQKYVLDYSKNKIQLMTMLRQNIEVSGVVEDNKRGRTLTVSSLRLLPCTENS